MRVGILDYGAGNIRSIKNALERQGASVGVERRADRLSEYGGAVLPGVGSFDPAMRVMGGTGDLKEACGPRPVLGICLGMEAFFESSAEGELPGLSVAAGRVVALPGTLKVPHMGWNSLEITGHSALLEGVKDGAWAYFVHSFFARPAEDVVAAESDYGVRVPAVVSKKNYFGTQFHPEKSGESGALMLANFLRECSK